MKAKLFVFILALFVIPSVVFAAGNCTKEGGKDYYKAGIAKVEGVGDSPDLCIGDKRLMEYYCVDNKLEYDYYDCNISCVDGACSGTSPIGCVENWTCFEWSACVNNQQTRMCVDVNKCGTELSMPKEVQSCTEVQPPVTPPVKPYQGLTKYRYYIIGGIIVLLIILYFAFRKKEPPIREEYVPEKKENGKK